MVGWWVCYVSLPHSPALRPTLLLRTWKRPNWPLWGGEALGVWQRCPVGWGAQRADKAPQRPVPAAVHRWHCLSLGLTCWPGWAQFQQPEAGPCPGQLLKLEKPLSAVMDDRRGSFRSLEKNNPVPQIEMWVMTGAWEHPQCGHLECHCG